MSGSIQIWGLPVKACVAQFTARSCSFPFGFKFGLGYNINSTKERDCLYIQLNWNELQSAKRLCIKIACVIGTGHLNRYNLHGHVHIDVNGWTTAKIFQCWFGCLVLGLFVTISVSFLDLFLLLFPLPSSSLESPSFHHFFDLLGFSLPNAPAVVGKSLSPIVDDDD